jgi:hypothetical protein
MGNIARWEDQDISHSKIEAKPRLVEAELTPLERAEGCYQAQAFVESVPVCPGTRLQVNNESPEGITGGGGMEREALAVDAEFSSILGEILCQLYINLVPVKKVVAKKILTATLRISKKSENASASKAYSCGWSRMSLAR